MNADFVERLVSFGSNLTKAERDNYKLLLGLATGGLATAKTVDERVVRDAAFRSTVSALARLQPYHERVSRSGTAYVGRPDFLTDDMLAAMQRESAQSRAAARRFDDHMLFSNAPLAKAFGASNELRDLIASAVGDVGSTGRANYIYYDEPGMGIDPHIDDAVFSLNTILMLSHTHGAEKSSLVLYPADGSVERYQLRPGELIVFFADSVVHQRERVHEGEALSIAAFGFKPIVSEEESS